MIAAAWTIAPGVGMTQGPVFVRPAVQPVAHPWLRPSAVVSLGGPPRVVSKGSGDLMRLRTVAPRETEALAARIQRTRIDTHELQVGRVVGRGPVKTSNPAMSAFSDLVAETARHDAHLFDGTQVLALQHMLGSTGGLLRGFVELGARPQDVVAMGKKYSQNAQVMDELGHDGFQVVRASREAENDVSASMEDLLPFRKPDDKHANRVTFEAAAGLPWSRSMPDRASELDRAIASVMARAAANPKGKVLVVDDGGELIQRIQDHHPELHDRIVAVEQTRKGIRRLEKMKLSFPVIDVAQSRTKLELESPMIGRSIAKTTIARIERVAQATGQQARRRVVAVGFGAVGAAACAALRDAGYEVEVYDRSPEARARAEKAGFRVHATEEAALPRAQVLLSMTGETVLDGKSLAQLPDGAMLVNGASSATELVPDRMDLMRGLVMNSAESTTTESRVFASFQGKRFHMGTLEGHPGWMKQRTVQGFDFPMRVTPNGQTPSSRDKQILLVNQGEVVNFDGSVDPIPPRYIQLTRGLLFLGSVQAMKTTEPGIHALSDETQQRWSKAVDAELATTSESLAHPTF